MLPLLKLPHRLQLGISQTLTFNQKPYFLEHGVNFANNITRKELVKSRKMQGIKSLEKNPDTTIIVLDWVP